MNKTIVILTFLLASVLLHAQTDSTTILLKDGTEIKAMVLKVSEWGFRLSDDKMALYRVIVEVTTSDTTLVHQVLEKTDSVTVRKRGVYTILDFEHFKFKTPPPSPVSMVTTKSLTFAWMVDYGLNYSFELDFSFRDLRPFILSPSVAFGSTVKTNHSLIDFRFGAGCLFEGETTRLALLLHYQDRFIDTDSDYNIEVQSLLFSADLHLLAGEEKKFIVTLGGYVPVTKVVYEGKRRDFGLRVGLGFNLSAFPFFNPSPEY